MTNLLRYLIGAMVTVLLLYANGGLNQIAPHCPTEDSCTVDYRDGAWHIEEVTP